MALQDFITGWNGQHISSVELIAHYAAECYGITLVKPEAASDYWNAPDETALSLFSRMGGNGVALGDVVLMPQNIGIVSDIADNTVTVLMVVEGVATIMPVSRDTIDGILRPHVALLPTVLAAPANIDDPDPLIPTATPKPPKGAERAPSPPYEPIVKAINAYISPDEAISGENPTTTIQPGSNYFMFTTKKSMVNVTLTSSMPGVWINPADNVADPEPEPVNEPEVEAENKGKLTPEQIASIRAKWENAFYGVSDRTLAAKYKLFLDDNGKKQVRIFVALRSVHLIDLQGKVTSRRILEGNGVEIVGYIKLDNNIYLRPKLMADQGLWACAPYNTYISGVMAQEKLDNFITIEEWRKRKADIEALEAAEFADAQRHLESIDPDPVPLTIPQYLLLAVEYIKHAPRKIIDWIKA